MTRKERNQKHLFSAVFLTWRLRRQVADDGLLAKTITQATNTKAGCVNGMDANGNPCVTKQKHDPICKVRSSLMSIFERCGLCSEVEAVL